MRSLFVTATRIGDAVLSSGLLDYLLRQHPGARITVAAGRLAVPLFLAVPGLERTIAIQKGRWKRHWLDLWRAAAGRRWDLVVDLRGSAIAYTLWTRRRLVLRPSKRPDEHRVAELGRLLGLDEPPAPRVWLSRAHRDAAAALVPDGGPVLAIAPAANWRGKQWRAERFGALAAHLTGAEGSLPGARVAVFAAEDERVQAAPLLEALDPARCVDLVGAVDLPTAAACLERCALFVGNDSGLMHLAAAAGTPTLGLFGPSRETRYAPWGASTGVVRTPESFDELTGAPGFDFKTTDTLMDGLTVEAVADAANRLWQRVCSD